MLTGNVGIGGDANLNLGAGGSTGGLNGNLVGRDANLSLGAGGGIGGNLEESVTGDLTGNCRVPQHHFVSIYEDIQLLYPFCTGILVWELILISRC